MIRILKIFIFIITCILLFINVIKCSYVPKFHDMSDNFEYSNYKEITMEKEKILISHKNNQVDVSLSLSPIKQSNESILLLLLNSTSTTDLFNGNPSIPPKPTPKPTPKPKPKPKPGPIFINQTSYEPSFEPTISPTTLASIIDYNNTNISLSTFPPSIFNSSDSESTSSTSTLNSSWVIYTAVCIVFVIFTFLYLIAFWGVYDCHFDSKRRNASSLYDLKELSKIIDSENGNNKDYNSTTYHNDMINEDYQDNSYQNKLSLSSTKSRMKTLYEIYDDSKSITDEENPLLSSSNLNSI